MARTVQGKKNTWRLSDNPIGSGDAGEVFAVTCVEQPEIIGVLKKPARIATGGTLQRQAGQIVQEGLALAALDGLPECKANPPRLIDKAPDFTTGTANYFIVSETAQGENLAAMLNQFRINDRPFPRRVIITVLDALFDLFARAHRAGILWNDVKLDHIYWHNPTGGVSVIDWGNAVFLENDQTNQRRVLPRWEDYRQLVDTLGSFLQQNAPELFNDLGWDEFQGQELNLNSVSILARRIAYQQEVIALRVMEFQALTKVVLSGDPTINGLESIQKYQKILEQIGAPWFSSEVLSYARQLVETQLIEDDRTSAVRTTTMIWDLFGETLDLSWHLLREYFQQTTLLTHPHLQELAKFTFAERWSDVIWTLALIAREQEEPIWWNRLVPVVRQKALGVASPAPYQLGESVLAWASTEKESTLANQLTQSLAGWRTKGKDLAASPFEYDLLDLVRGQSNLPRRVKSELKHIFAAGEEAIRALFQAWVNPEWEALPKALHLILSWDPDRWGILHLADVLTDFRTWMEKLYEGPEQLKAVPAYLDSLLAEMPPIARLLGSAPWYKTMLDSLKSIREGAPIREFRPVVQAWYPWLLPYTDIHTTLGEKPEQNPKDIISTLQQFVQHLKTWSDVDSGLMQVKSGAPAYYKFCKRLADAFRSIVALTTDLNRIEEECSTPIHDTLQEPCKALHDMLEWRRYVGENNLDEALLCLGNRQNNSWRLLEHAEQITINWLEMIQPQLIALMQLSTPQDALFEDESRLASSVKAAVETKKLWESIYSSGLHQDVLDKLSESIETVRTSFFAWRHEMESSEDQTRYLLYHSQLAQIRALSDIFLKLSQHIRQARLSYGTLSQENDLPFTVQLRSAENLLDHMMALDSHLIPEENDRQFPNWRQAFEEVQSAETKDIRREKVLALSSEHPLYTWLVQSLLA